MNSHRLLLLLAAPVCALLLTRLLQSRLHSRGFFNVVLWQSTQKNPLIHWKIWCQASLQRKTRFRAFRMAIRSWKNLFIRLEFKMAEKVDCWCPFFARKAYSSMCACYKRILKVRSKPWREADMMILVWTLDCPSRQINQVYNSF